LPPHPDSRVKPRRADRQVAVRRWFCTGISI
jgi:hypothetical protein